jgi:hypothetical protein
MAILRVHTTRDAVAVAVIVGGGALLLGWVIWSVVVAFSGGTVPILGLHTRASPSHGLIVLFGLGGLAIGLFALIVSGAQWLTRQPQGAD